MSYVNSDTVFPLCILSFRSIYTVPKTAGGLPIDLATCGLTFKLYSYGLQTQLSLAEIWVKQVIFFSDMKNNDLPCGSIMLISGGL